MGVLTQETYAPAAAVRPPIACVSFDHGKDGTFVTTPGKVVDLCVMKYSLDHACSWTVTADLQVVAGGRHEGMCMQFDPTDATGAEQRITISRALTDVPNVEFGFWFKPTGPSAGALASGSARYLAYTASANNATILAVLWMAGDATNPGGKLVMAYKTTTGFFSSSLSFPVVVGTWYWIRCAGHGGNFTLEVYNEQGTRLFSDPREAIAFAGNVTASIRKGAGLIFPCLIDDMMVTFGSTVDRMTTPWRGGEQKGSLHMGDVDPAALKIGGVTPERVYLGDLLVWSGAA